jgi:DNA ligase-1
MSTLRYEFEDPTVGSSKFWEVEHPLNGDERQFRTTWGRIGGSGQTEVAKYKTAEEAKKKLASKIREKERKGYELTSGDRRTAEKASDGPGKEAKGLKAGGKFSLQLLKPWDGETLPDRAVVEPKIDGLRAFFVFSGDRFCCYSRNGNTLNNVLHVAAELYRAFDGYCLDGELIAGTGTWEDTMSDARADQRGDGTSGLYFAAFDCLTHEEIDTRTCGRTLEERRELMERLWPKRTLNSGILIQKPVRSAKDAQKAANAYIKDGFEGAVVKDLDSFYAFRRTDDWTKIKEFETHDYKIVGFEEGKGKFLGTFGKFLVKGPKGKVSGVGSGISVAQRNEFWKLGKKLIGKIVEVKHQGVSPDGGLRFPTFIRLRLDK